MLHIEPFKTVSNMMIKLNICKLYICDIVHYLFISD